MALPLEDITESAVPHSPAGSSWPPDVDSGTGALPTPEESERAELLARADAARDARRWTEAADAYRALLELDPLLAPIWVQYGHMLKEAGQRDDARLAYEHALELDPGNPDTHLQMGHLFKITNKKVSAIEAYGRALQIDPSFYEAEMELRVLGASARVDKILERALEEKTTEPDQPELYFDISDLIFHHFPSNRSPTGIQRIVLAVAEAALAAGKTRHVGLCVLEGDTGQWKLVDNESALHLMMLSHEGAANSDSVWQSALGDVHRAIWNSAPLQFPCGSTVISLGAPWGIRRYFAAIRAAKRQYGIRCVGYIHDTVPLLYPEYCDGVIPQEFLRWLRRLSRHADLMLANSHSTKRDFQQALSMLGVASVDCEVVYPSGDFTSLFERTGDISPEVAAMAGAKYALFVGTIQPRKNHLMIVSGWRHLIRELGPENVPDLVLAGKLGWYWEQLVEFLRKTDNVGGKVLMLNKASDADLQALYKGAMFTIYNSHYEGWGLPVTESLSFGKVPVISRNSALLESGGKYALFYETNSEPSFVNTVRNILKDPEILAEREKLILSDPPVRPWSDVFEETREVIQRVFAGRAATVSASQSEIRLGNVYRFGATPDQATDSDFADWEFTEDIMANVSQWWEAEDWGVWTRSRTVELKFDLPGSISPATGDNLRLFLHLRGHREEAQVTIELNGTSLEPAVVRPGAEPVLSIALTPEMIEEGKLEIRIYQSALTDLEKVTGGVDRRSIGIGIRALMVCQPDDLAARLTFLEGSAGYNTVAVAASAANSRPRAIGPGAEAEEEGGFLRLGGKRADVAHAPEELVRAAKSL